MENLIADHLSEASTAHTANMIAEAAPAAEATDERLEPPAHLRHPAAPQHAPVQAAESGIEEGDTAAGDDEAPAAQTTVARTSTMAYAPEAEQAAADPGLAKGADGRPAAKARRPARTQKTSAAAAPPEKPADRETDRRLKHQTTAGRSVSLASAKPEASGQPHKRGGATVSTGWTIQIGATDDPAKANALLVRARQHNRSTLASAKPVTEKVRRGTDTVYRARFAMLEFGIRQIGLPLPQTQRIFLLPRPRLKRSKPLLPQEPRLALSLHQNILGLIDPRGKRGRAAMIWMKLFHQGSMSANNVRRARALGEAQDFERIPARHRAASAAPPLTLTLVCLTPAGEPAVEIRL